MQIGDINVTNAILTLELEVKVLQKALTYVIDNNKGLKVPTQAAIDSFKEKSLKEIQVKYPNMGIKSK